MKTLATMLSAYFSKFKTRDLIMSGILVAVIIAYGWDDEDTTSLPASTPAPQQQYTPAQQPPAQPQPSGQVRSAQIQQHPSGKFRQGQSNYQQERYPTSQAPNTYPGQTMGLKRPAY
jgi:hypothetical protein